MADQGVDCREQLGVGLQQPLDRRTRRGAVRVARCRRTHVRTRIATRAERVAHEAREQVDRPPCDGLGGLVVEAGEIEQIGEGDAPLEQEQRGARRRHVLLRIALEAGDPTGNQQLLGLDGLEQGQRDPGLRCELDQRVGRGLLGGGATRSDRVGYLAWCSAAPLGPRAGKSRELAEQRLVGRVEFPGDQAGDGGEGEAALLEGPDPGKSCQVDVVVPGDPALASRWVEEALALVVAHGVHRHARACREVFDPHLHAPTLGVHARIVRVTGRSSSWPGSSSGVVAVDHLGHAARLRRALGFEGEVDDHLDPVGDDVHLWRLTAPIRRLLPTGTGEGKRTLLQP